MTTTLFGITWTLDALVYAPLLLFFFLLLVWRLVRAKKIIAGLAAARWQSLLMQRSSPVRRGFKFLLRLLGFAGLFLALLHPSWGHRDEVVAQQGRDLFIALDISRSMLAQDVKPNRLAHAKKKIKELVSRLSSERVGLILFSGYSLVQCPLTSDYAAFFMFLDAVDAETVGSGTTALDQVIQKVISLFKEMPTKKNKLLVLFTDGEDFSTSLGDCKQQARDLGLHIFTVGVGTGQGAPVPVIDDRGEQQGVERDAKGAVVISRLNEGILSNLARETGGTYVHSAATDADVKKLVACVEQYEKERLEDKKVSHEEEQYPFFLAVSFFCYALEWLL